MTIASRVIFLSPHERLRAVLPRGTKGSRQCLRGPSYPPISTRHYSTLRLSNLRAILTRCLRNVRLRAGFGTRIFSVQAYLNPWKIFVAERPHEFLQDR